MNDLNPWKLCDDLDSVSKFWWGAHLILRMFVFVVGVLGVFFDDFSFVVSLGALVLYIFAEMADIRSGNVRSNAHRLRRMLEFQDGLGWKIDMAEYSDIAARAPTSIKKHPSKQHDEPYFASRESVGTRRLIENLSESAWWSKRLAESMRFFSGVVVILMVLSSIFALIIAMKGFDDQQVRNAVARIVIAFFIFIISMKLIRLVISYHQFAVNAGHSEQSAQLLSRNVTINEVEAILALHEYQCARLPTVA